MFNARKLFVGLVFSSFLSVGIATPAQAAEQGALQTFQAHHESIQKLKKGKNSEKVIQDSEKVMTEFFGCEVPINWKN